MSPETVVLAECRVNGRVVDSSKAELEGKILSFLSLYDLTGGLNGQKPRVLVKVGILDLNRRLYFPSL